MKVLLEHAHVEGIRYYEAYRTNGGYRSVEKAFKMTPEEIVEEVKKSGGWTDIEGTICLVPTDLRINRLSSKLKLI